MNKGSRQTLVRSTFRSCSDVVAAIIFALLLASCANVTFHPGMPDGTPGGGTEPNLSKQTGLKYYTAKPYLLVGPTGNKDAPLKAEIISLPDLEHPTYAIYHPGWGQHIFSLAVASNGNLSSYGQTADSKIPETITALGSLMGGAGSLAAAIKPVASAMAADTKNLAPTTSPGPLVQAAIEELNKVGTATPPGPLVTDSAKTAEKLAADLSNLLINGRLTEDTLKEISGRIEKSKIDHPSGNSAAQTINQFYKQAQNNINAAIEAIQAGQPAKADFKLFEIRMKDGKTCLIPADCKLASQAIHEWGYSK